MDAVGIRCSLDGAHHPTARGRAGGIRELPLEGVLQRLEDACPALSGECTSANAGEVRGRMLGEHSRLRLRWAGIRAGVVSAKTSHYRKGPSTSVPLLFARAVEGAAAVSVLLLLLRRRRISNDRPLGRAPIFAVYIIP